MYTCIQSPRKLKNSKGTCDQQEGSICSRAIYETVMDSSKEVHEADRRIIFNIREIFRINHFLSGIFIYHGAVFACRKYVRQDHYQYHDGKYYDIRIWKAESLFLIIAHFSLLSYKLSVLLPMFPSPVCLSDRQGRWKVDPGQG